MWFGVLAGKFYMNYFLKNGMWYIRLYVVEAKSLQYHDKLFKSDKNRRIMSSKKSLSKLALFGWVMIIFNFKFRKWILTHSKYEDKCESDG